MAVTSAIHVTCPQCGMRARAIKRESGPETRVTDRVSKCRRGKQGMDVVSCPALKMRLLPQPKGEPRCIIRSEEDPEREYTAEASELRRLQGGR